MDEYINREDALDAVLFALAGTGHQSRAINGIKYLPIADVVPRAEVAREIFEEIEKNADFLFDGFRNIVVLTEKDFEKLKKKYTEGGNQE